MAEDLMRYDLMAQDALRNVVRQALLRVAKDGLPGEHHFYISFKTTAPKVAMSDRLASQYPNEMTIVLQHQFWNLEVDEDGFSVELTFNRIPEKLYVPFAALLGFYDPSVQFGLQFAPGSGTEAATAPQAQNADEKEPSRPDGGPQAPDGTPAAGEVVSLDAFRKK